MLRTCRRGRPSSDVPVPDRPPGSPSHSFFPSSEKKEEDKEGERNNRRLFGSFPSVPYFSLLLPTRHALCYIPARTVEKALLSRGLPHHYHLPSFRSAQPILESVFGEPPLLGHGSRSTGSLWWIVPHGPRRRMRPVGRDSNGGGIR